MTIWYERFNPPCFFCIVARYHFFHNNGDVNTDPMTRAKTDCSKCLAGEVHFTHDTDGRIEPEEWEI